MADRVDATAGANPTGICWKIDPGNGDLHLILPFQAQSHMAAEVLAQLALMLHGTEAKWHTLAVGQGNSGWSNIPMRDGSRALLRFRVERMPADDSKPFVSDDWLKEPMAPATVRDFDIGGDED